MVSRIIQNHNPHRLVGVRHKEGEMEDPYEEQIHRCGKCYWRYIMTLPNNRKPKRPEAAVNCYMFKEMVVRCKKYEPIL